MGGIVVNFVQSVIAWFGRQERQLCGEREAERERSIDGQK